LEVGMGPASARRNPTVEIRYHFMQESEAIRLAIPLLESCRKGVEAADCEIAGGDVVICFSGAPRAVLIRGNDIPTEVSGKLAIRDFWLVTVRITRQYRDGRPFDSVGDAESISVLVDDATGHVEAFRTL
jgi:hypothetical protein